MQFFSRIALALFLTSACAFAEELVPTDPMDTGNVTVVETVGSQTIDRTAEAAPATSGEESTTLSADAASATSSEIASVSPAPWTDTMSSFRSGGSPEGARNPNELHAINWSDEKTLLIGAGILIFIILLIAIAD